VIQYQNSETYQYMVETIHNVKMWTGKLGKSWRRVPMTSGFLGPRKQPRPAQVQVQVQDGGGKRRSCAHRIVTPQRLWLLEIRDHPGTRNLNKDRWCWHHIEFLDGFTVDKSGWKFCLTPSNQTPNLTFIFEQTWRRIQGWLGIWYHLHSVKHMTSMNGLWTSHILIDVRYWLTWAGTGYRI